MIARVVDYQVGLCRGRKENPIRTLDLVVECPDDRNLKHVFLRFFEKKQDSLGFVNTVSDNIVAMLPLEDFALARELLQGDEDVFFAWVADSNANLVWTEITTAETPLRSQHLEGEERRALVVPIETAA